MHGSVHTFIASAVTRADIAGKDVTEAGALNVNGTVRPALEAFGPASYLATDMREGPGVDKVLAAENLEPLSADVIVTTEMLEHAQDWQRAMIGMVSALRPHGLLILTTRGPGFAYHDHPGDYWRFTPGLMLSILQACSLTVVRCEPDPECPGVFATAFKETEVSVINLTGLEAAPPC